MHTPWIRFKRCKRALWSLRFFGFILLLTAFVPFVCNDRPIMIFHKGHFFFPIWKYYPQTAFGGKFDLETDYLGETFTKITEKSFVLWPLVHQSPYTVDSHRTAPSAPTTSGWIKDSDGKDCFASGHWLGTDDQGRDVLTRLLYGLRTSLFFALALATLSGFIGLVVGAVQGYYGGLVDILLQRFMEIWSGLPILFVLMILSSLVQPTIWWLLFIMAAFNWTQLVNVVRVEFLRARKLTFVKAANVLGVSSLAIAVRHILPNVMASVISYFPSLVSQSIATLTALDFLGFGLPSGTPSLGELLEQAKNNLHAPWLSLTSFVSIAIVLVLVTFIGEGLKEAFDPKSV